MSCPPAVAFGETESVMIGGQPFVKSKRKVEVSVGLFSCSWKRDEVLSRSISALGNESSRTKVQQLVVSCRTCMTCDTDGIPMDVSGCKGLAWLGQMPRNLRKPAAYRSWVRRLTLRRAVQRHGEMPCCPQGSYVSARRDLLFPTYPLL